MHILESSLPDATELGLTGSIANEYTRARHGVITPDVSKGRLESSARSIRSLYEGGHINLPFMTPQIRAILGLDQEGMHERKAA